MKKFFLLIVLLVSFSCFCQPTMLSEAKEPVTLMSTILSIFLPAIVAQIMVLFADAKKWYGSDSWSWSIFIYSKIVPFLLTTVGGVLLYILLTYLPIAKPFIEIFTGSPIVELTSASLFGVAVAIIDGFMKKAND